MIGDGVHRCYQISAHSIAYTQRYFSMGNKRWKPTPKRGLDTGPT